MGNSITVTNSNYDRMFTDDEYTQWKDGLLRNGFTIARNTTQYMYNERVGIKQAELYWSPKEGTIKGRVYEAKRMGDWNNPYRYYVKILYDDVVNTKAQLTAFNKSKGKRADSAAGHTWNKRWYTPFHQDLAMGNRMPLGEVWKQAKQKPYDFMDYKLGIINQHKI